VSEWCAPKDLPDLRRVGLIALDTETRDDRLRNELGSGWPFRQGHVCGISVACRAEGGTRGFYFPIRHLDTPNFEPEQVYQWVRDHIAAGVRFVTQNGLYDWGWLRTEAGIRMPPSEQLEEIGALATMVDENRFKYSLDALCAWRELPGKDDTLLRVGITALGLISSKRKKLTPQNHIWQLPAHYVGPYAEADAVNTLALFESLNPILDQEGTRAAYRLECDILPMVLEMLLRGIRVDLDAAARAHDLLLSKRDAALAELSKELGCAIGMHELQGRKWLVQAFEREKVSFPRTKQGNPSFAGGKLGWMTGHAHYLPRLIAVANKYNKAAGDFLQAHIIGHAVNGRLHAEINPHRSEASGTKSSRFSYSDPPLQQMPSRDPELAPLIRGVFLPEDGEVWAKPDASQQEFRFVVHYANQHHLRRAAEAVARYRDDADADFHALAATITGLDRSSAKAVNFAKIYGAGVAKFAAMIGKPVEEAQRLYNQYDRELPFLHELSKVYGRRAEHPGYITLYDGARRHFNRFAPPGKWSKGAGPCGLEEAHARVRDPGHPWYRERLQRVDQHTALNALIQGSAARHTKLWMRACWREGIVPLLQMHDCLDCSVGSREQAELVARLGEEAVQLDVPMRVDLKYGRTWGDASHTWDELNGTTPRMAATASTISIPESSQGLQWATPTIVELIGVMPWDVDPINYRPPPPPPPKSNGRYPSGNHDQPERGRLVAQYVYLDAGGRNYLQVRRYEWFTTTADGTSEKQKSFPQYRWTGTQWAKGCKGLPKIPFRLPELIAAPRTTLVAICAGEKDVLTLARLGYVATCNPGGEIPKAWTPELNCWFVGRPVIIVEDNDDTGRAHTREVAQALAGVAASIKVLRFPDVPEHEDITWWVEGGHGKDELDARIAAAPPPDDGTLESVRASSIEMEALDWLWPERFALGKIGIIAGLPDEGKGQLLAYIAARCTRADLSWPNDEGRAPLGNMLLLTAEDDPKDTVVPRFAAAGADLDRIEIVKMVRDRDDKSGQQRRRTFSLVNDLEKLRQKIVEVGDVVLILIDPISAYLGVGKVDSFRDADVRAVLTPLKELAEELRVAVVAIMHFNKRADVLNMMLRICNSIAFAAASRHAFGIVDDPDHARKLMVRGKNNLARKDDRALAFHFDEREVGKDRRNNKSIRAPFIVFEPGYVDITASEALQAVNNNKAPGARDEAKKFLSEFLACGPKPSAEVEEAAEANGISRRTLFRVKGELLIAARKDGMTGGWVWQLPE
jgi:putative DNA primase/helicase